MLFSRIFFWLLRFVYKCNFRAFFFVCLGSFIIRHLLFWVLRFVCQCFVRLLDNWGVVFRLDLFKVNILWSVGS